MNALHTRTKKKSKSSQFHTLFVSQRSAFLSLIVVSLGLLVLFLAISFSHKPFIASASVGTPNPIVTPTASSAAPVTLTSCPGNISQSGNYVLGQDLVQPNNSVNPCVEFSNVSQVSLDCQGHTITQGDGSVTAVETPASGTVSNLIIKNCTFTNSAYLAYVSVGEFSNNTVKGSTAGSTSSSIFDVVNSNNITFDTNTFANTLFNEKDSSYIQFSNNTISYPTGVASASLSGVVNTSNSSHNNIMNNIIDGIWTSSMGTGEGTPASDDGVMLVNSSNDYLYNNTIKNNFDCGIETEGQITSDQLYDNIITNAGNCGIGGWYQNSWLNNIVQGNTVNQAKMLFEMYLNTTQLVLNPNPSIYYFQGNQFIGNKFASGIASNSNSANMNYQDLSQAPGVTPSLGNNTFQNNDFGTFDMAPNLLPSSMIVDQGGNTCGGYTVWQTQSLACSVVTPTPTLTSTPTASPVPSVTPTLIPTATPTSTPIPTATPTPTPTPDRTAPTVSITSPLNGSAVPRGSFVTIQVNATDNVGVTKVEVYVNNSLLCTDTASPYGCGFTASSRKRVSYSIQAKAFDAAGNVGLSSTVKVTTK